MLLIRLTLLALLCAGVASAEPLADMAGTWRGSGWARETVAGPQETLRCQLSNRYDAVEKSLTLSGECIVSGRRLSIAGTLTGTEGAQRITGRWSNPDGIGTTRVVGLQRDGIVAFNFRAVDPKTGRQVAQNIEWGISEGALRLRATDRGRPDRMMADISFTR
jgi:hypothetical protein